MRKRLFFFLLLAIGSPVAAERQSLGIFGQWGAFRDKDAALRCFAIAEPERVPRAKTSRPFASIGFWPSRNVRSQVHVRLSRIKRPGSAVLLRIDDRTFQLLAGGANAWAPDRQTDAAIVDAMRGGIDMVVETRSDRGALFRDSYRLSGAATAIDAAAIACSRPR
jgi:hypothetical protein